MSIIKDITEGDVLYQFSMDTIGLISQGIGSPSGKPPTGIVTSYFNYSMSNCYFGICACIIIQYIVYITQSSNPVSRMTLQYPVTINPSTVSDIYVPMLVSSLSDMTCSALYLQITPTSLNIGGNGVCGSITVLAFN